MFVLTAAVGCGRNDNSADTDRASKDLRKAQSEVTEKSQELAADEVSIERSRRSVAAEQDGLRTGIAIPIRAEGCVIGALTFFSAPMRPADRELLQMLDTAGSQIGLFIERKRAEQTHWAQAHI